MTSYLTAIVMLFLSVIIFKYSLSNYAWFWPWLLEWVNVKLKYANRKIIHDYAFDGNSSVCPTFHIFQEICFRIVDILTLTFTMGHGEMDFLFDGNNSVFPVTISKTLTLEMGMNLPSIFRMCQYICKSKAHIRLRIWWQL